MKARNHAPSASEPAEPEEGIGYAELLKIAREGPFKAILRYIRFVPGATRAP